MQGNGINLNKEYKKLIKKAYSEPLTAEEISEFETMVNNAKDAGKLSSVQIKNQEKHIEELKKYVNDTKKVKKLAILTGVAGTVLVAALAAGAVSCAKNKNKNSNVVAETTTEDETKNDFENDSTKFDTEELKSLENNAKELVNALVERGYKIDDKETFTKKIVEGRIALSIDKLSPYKEISQLLTSGNINAKNAAIEMQNLIPTVFKTVMVSNKNIDWKLMGVNDATAKFLNNYTDKLLGIKNAKTVEERQSLVTDLQSFLTDYQKIAIDSSESYKSTDLYVMHTVTLYGDELVKSATNISQFVGTDVSKFINSLPCDKPVYIEEFDYDNSDKFVNEVSSSLGIDVRADQFNDTIRNLSASFDSAEKMVVNGTVIDSEYGYGKIVSRIYDQIKENESQIDVEASYDSMVNSLRNELNQYISSKSNLNTVDKNDHFVTDNNGNSYVVPDSTIKNNGATNIDDYKQNVEKDTNEKLEDKTTVTDNSGNVISSGKDAIEDTGLKETTDANGNDVYYSEDYEIANKQGFEKGYYTGLNGEAQNYSSGVYVDVNGDGEVNYYDTGYIDGYTDGYSIGSSNRVKEPETKVEYVPVEGKEVETITEQKKVESVKAYETETTVSSNIPSYDFDYSQYGDDFEPIEGGPIDMGENVVISSGKVR